MHLVEKHTYTGGCISGKMVRSASVCIEAEESRAAKETSPEEDEEAEGIVEEETKEEEEEKEEAGVAPVLAAAAVGTRTPVLRFRFSLLVR